MVIRWDDLEPQKCEDMVSVLLSRLHPDSQRIDGKGGDGGRDVQIVGGVDDAMEEAFQLKSFTGRMDSSRRKQVASSLKRAAELKPDQWTLIVPIDPTPSEDKWFRQLGSRYPFPTRWLGKTWLDEKMSAFPDIRRYFLEGAKDEVYRLLWEIREEQAIITDVQDAVVRVQTLRERLNEIDPYYRYELSTGPNAAEGRPTNVVFSAILGDMRVDVYPKYAGATKDRPVTISTKLIVGPGSKVVQDALDYGLEIDIPSEMIANIKLDAPSGLGGSFTGGYLHLSPNNPTLSEPLPLTLTVMDGNKPLASVPVEITERTGGLRGLILTGSDSTGWLQIRLKVDMEAKKLEAKFWLNPKSAIPAHLVPLFRWIRLFQLPNRLVLRWPNGSETGSAVGIAFPLHESIGQVIEALAYLQERSRQYWKMHPSSLEEDGQDILKAAALLKGETINLTWKPFNLTLDELGPGLQEFLNGHSQQVIIEHETSLKLEEAIIPLGRIRTYFGSTRLANPTAVKQALASGLPATVQLAPGESNKAQQMVVSQPQ